MSEGIKSRVYRAVLDAKGLRYDPPSLASQGQVKEAIAITNAVVRSLSLADDEGAGRAVYTALMKHVGDLIHEHTPEPLIHDRETRVVDDILEALDRYLSGEQGAK